MKRVAVTYVGWTYEGKKNVKKEITIRGKVSKESEKMLVLIDDEGTGHFIRKGSIRSVNEE